MGEAGRLTVTIRMKSLAPYAEYSHHLCHASNAFFSSNFKDSLIITLDGGGWEINRDYHDVADENGADKITAAALYVGTGTKIHPAFILRKICG